MTANPEAPEGPVPGEPVPEGPSPERPALEGSAPERSTPEGSALEGSASERPVPERPATEEPVPGGQALEGAAPAGRDARADSVNSGGGAEARLARLGLTLPETPAPVGNFDLGSIDGETLYLSGQGPMMENGVLAKGKVGADVSLEEANYHARRTGLVLIAAMKEILGSLDHVAQVRRVFGMVNAAPDFEDHPAVLNGCSDLFCEVFGARGRHARAAVGMGSLPGNITVEIEAIVSISPGWRPRP